MDLGRNDSVRRGRKGVFSAALMATAAIGPMLFAPVALAQTAAADRNFDIPPQPLADALVAFAAQSGYEVTTKGAELRGIQSNGVRGRQAPVGALGQILSGTGFTFRINGNLVTLERAPQSAEGAITLGPVRVEGASGTSSGSTTSISSDVGATEGTGSYTQTGASSTATKLGLTLRETPQSVSVITRQQMDDFALNSIAQVIEHTPGMTVDTLDSERLNFTVRGFSANFQYDGISIPYDSAYAAGNALSDMVIYDRVEVIKGSTGLVNGSGEPGATINLIRKRPTRDFQAHAGVTIGSWNNYRGELDVSGPLNKAGTLRGRAVASYQYAESHLDHHRRKIPVLYGILEADLTPNTMLTVGADYQETNPRGSSWGGIRLFDSNGDFNDMPRSFNPATRWSRYAQYTRSLFAKLEHRFDNEWTARLQLNYQINGYESYLGSLSWGNVNPVDGSGAVFLPGSYVGKTRSIAGDIYARGPLQLFGRQHELVVGATINDRRWTNTTYSTATGYSYTDYLPSYYDWNGDIPELPWNAIENLRETTHDNGIYTTARWNLIDGLKLITGLRVSNYSRNSAASGTTMRERGVTTPYVGVVYDITKTLSAYASYTDIFQPQSVKDEQGATLDPLTGSNYEAGLKGAFFGGRLNASTAIFRIKQDNYAQLSGGLTPTGGNAYEAINGVVTKGFELELSGQLTPQWQIQTGFTHQIARRQEQRVATETPENQFSLFTSYKPGGVFDGLTLGGGARWQDKTWANVSNPVQGTVKHVMPDRWLFDAMASYRVNDKLSASANIRNLFDKKYYTIFTAYSTYMWGAPRSFSVNIRYDF